ncbi:putative nucleotidyltransferase with HDIG domain [Paucimonas lemoignei]|uniref:Putative nucleotidyltransferase with HDIG domain n=1 Tax=Paucimonas lemoignei TaxID=29443 RepID=A0A4R3I012_PAULE|nr:HD domain-containing phosphohydrolase [Paucimonas lemoignei]TCS37885.1 putative nucleotidyltransferase with HDIG domain [Paucimonas lemoignei]
MANFLAILSGGGVTLLIVALFLSISNLAALYLSVRKQHLVRSALFVFTALGVMMFPVYGGGDTLLDQRAAILAVATIFGSVATAMMTALAMLIYRAYVGGSAMLAGLLGITLMLAVSVLLVKWWRHRHAAQPYAGRLILAAGIAAGLCSVVSLLLVGPGGKGLDLVQQEGWSIFLVQVVSTCLFGFMLKLHVEREHNLEELRQKNSALRDTLVQTIGALSAAMMHRDPAVASHEKRVAELAVAIGAEFGFDRDRLEALKLAAMVHDIGMMQLPAEILMRPRKLTEQEFALVKLHAQNGYEILRTVEFPWPLADIVHQHHENFDGSGYPLGLSGEAISLEARILRVADSMEAMLSHRPFRRAHALDHALASLEQGKGKAYDPQVADACLRVLRDNKFSFVPPVRSAA